MKYTIILTTAAVLALSACQSTKSPEEEAMLSNLCTTGDATGDMATMEKFSEAVMQCGGYEVFTDSMLIGQKFSFAFSKKAGPRELTFNPDGSAQYYRINKGVSESVNWTITDKGNLLLTWEDGYKWEWALMSENGGFMAVKAYGSAVDGNDEDIFSMVVAVSSGS